MRMDRPPTPQAASAPIKVRAAVVSLITGIVILALKMAAYLATGSVALLSDAAESVINVIAANIALASLVVASQPPDEHHQYGHAKAEYVSSATEAAMIGVAGLVITATAINRLVHPLPLRRLPLGLALMGLAAAANLVVGWVLLRISRSEHSIALEASAKHLMSDVITSAGVFVGVALVILTGWTPLDALAAVVVGANIAWIGIGLYRRSISGLMDARLPPEEEAKIREVLDAHLADIVEYHAMRTRRAGSDRFLDLHLVVHRSATVGEAHDLTDHLEQHLEEVLPGIDVTIHTEPCASSCARCAGSARPTGV
jgi:cation diffusion facilitator family transporter